MTRRGLVLFGLMSVIWGMGLGFALVIVGSMLATRLPNELRDEHAPREVVAPQPSTDLA